MHQTFTGTSRRQRQVNLSGRPSNPFASASGKAGPQSAVASAQQDRINRQQQREKLQASSRIQRVWRGHSARRKTFETWRRIWDELEDEDSRAHGTYRTPQDSLSQLNRLLLFYNPQEDVKRLTWYGMRQVATSDAVPCEGEPWPKAYLNLQRACVSALRVRIRPNEEVDKVLLTTLAFATKRSVLDQRDAIAYYEALTALRDIPVDLLQNALIVPLRSSPDAYVGLGVLLSRPLDAQMLALLRSSIDAQALAQALTRLIDTRNNESARSRLWLLGNTIFLAGNIKSEWLTTLVTKLLGSLADEVEFESSPIDLDNILFDRDVLSKASTGLPINIWLHEQISSLINQDSIRNLFVRGSGTTANTRLLAGYALTLLRCFPRRADDIRMWLYLGPTHAAPSNLPATQYFWNAAKTNAVFSTVCQNSRNAVALLKTSETKIEARDDWTVILVFLELYTFLLKIMDDEEFMGSGKKPTAIPLPEVADLVTFLKNLGFTLYFNASELNVGADTNNGAATSPSLSRHFGNAPIKSETSKSTDVVQSLVVAGLPGLTIDYLKGLVTGLLRANI